MPGVDGPTWWMSNQTTRRLRSHRVVCSPWRGGVGGDCWRSPSPEVLLHCLCSACAPPPSGQEIAVVNNTLEVTPPTVGGGRGPTRSGRETMLG